MKKTKIFGLFVVTFSAIFFLAAILIGSIVICINKFIDLPGMICFFRGVTTSGIVAFIGAALIVRGTIRFGENKFSFWLGKNYPKLILGYILVVLTITSINSQPIWNADTVSEVLSLQWTIFGLSLTIFLVWNVIMVEFLKAKQPKVSDSSSLYQKFTLALEKKTYTQEVDTTFNSVILLTINLFLLLSSTTMIYISMTPESVITQNVLLCSFFITINSIIRLFVDILSPLKKEKEEMLKNNSVTKLDIDTAYAVQVTQAIIVGITQGVMALDSDKYTEEDKKKLIVEYLTALKDYVENRENSDLEKQNK